MIEIDYECGECLELKSTHTDDTDHEFELGCYCGERGKCEVCVDGMIHYAEYLRDSAKESA